MSVYVCEECGQSYGGPGNCACGGRLQPWGEDPLLGQMVGSYRIARLLGAGGMGRVYRAVQPSIGSRVAVKVLAGEMARDRELVERFFAEARAVNLIQHENLVNVLDLAFLPDGRPYIVMEYLDGAPLSGIIGKRGQLPLGTLARLMSEVLDAVGAAHQKNIVHRDLKPDNVFVTPTGRPEVLDFGIAKLQGGADGGGAHTRAGAILGTPAYMSPEQAQGLPVDARSDLYSIGVMLYEAATGKPPFVSDALFDLLRMHVAQAPVPPRTLRPDLPKPLEAVILRALEKDPARRYRTAGEMARALLHAAEGLPAAQWAPLQATSSIAAVGGPASARLTGALSMPPAPRPRSWLVPVLVGIGLAGAAVAVAVVVAGGKGKSGGGDKGGGDVKAAGMDPDHFDVVGYLPEALAAAKKTFSDAGLVMLMAYNVSPDGTSVLGFDGQSSAVYQFLSPSHKPNCLVNVVANRNGITSKEMPDPMGTCQKRTLSQPKCSAAAIWARVKKQKPSLAADKAMVMFQDMQGYDQWLWMGPANQFFYFDDKCQ